METPIFFTRTHATLFLHYTYDILHICPLYMYIHVRAVVLHYIFIDLVVFILSNDTTK